MILIAFYFKVFSGCGQPRYGRKKREAEAAAASYEDFSFGWKPGRKHNQQQIVRPTTAAGTSLDRLVRDIKGKVEIAKDFWKDLPHSICNSEAAELNNTRNCWNGQSKAKYVICLPSRHICRPEWSMTFIMHDGGV